MEIEYDRELLRKQILQSMSGATFWGYTLKMIWDHVSHHYEGRLSPEFRILGIEEVLSLLNEGAIRPHFDFENGDARMRWDHFHLTEYGKSILTRNAEHPFFEREYLNRIKKIIQNGMELDDVVEFYVRESVQLFRNDFYSSAVVMLGVASERIIDLIGTAILETLKDSTKGRFRRVMEHRGLSDKIDLIKTTVESSCRDTDLRDFFDYAFTGFVTLLRKSRNQYGHPSGTSATRDEALEYLYTFPQYVKRMYQIIEYYQNTVLPTFVWDSF